MNLEKVKLSSGEGVVAVIETPRGCPYKYNYDPKAGTFRLTSALPAGSVFPYDFGFIPSTLAEDGDPLDVLVLMEVPTFNGCLLDVRVIGVIEAEQGKGKKAVRNDRLIAVAAVSHAHRDTRGLEDIGKPTIDEIECFFRNYNDQKGEPFQVLGLYGAKRANRLLDKSHRRFLKSQQRSRKTRSS